MKWNIISIYVVKLKSVLHSQFFINLDKIWYVQVYTQGTSAHQILHAFLRCRYFKNFLVSGVRF